MTIFENRTETLREETPSVKANRRQCAMLKKKNRAQPALNKGPNLTL
jgi:hypothetical protein